MERMREKVIWDGFAMVDEGAHTSPPLSRAFLLVSLRPSSEHCP
jgi:hypothetical protein